MKKTPINEKVVLIIDEEHPRHGRIARIAHDERKSWGTLGVIYSDGGYDEFPPMPETTLEHQTQVGEFHKSQGFYDRRSNSGPESLEREFLEHGGTPEQLRKQYRELFGEEFEAIPREIAKEN